MGKCIEIYKKTKDDWHGNCIAGGHRLVEVRLSQTSPIGKWRVGIWGTDDYGLIKNHYDYEQALATFIEVVKLPFVDIYVVKEILGFEVF